MSISLNFLNALLFAAICISSSFGAAKPVSILHVYGLGSDSHTGLSVPSFTQMMANFKTKYGADTTSSNREDIVDSFSKFDIVLFNSVGASAFHTLETKSKLQKWLEAGGRAIGFHASNDHDSYWPWWTDLHGGSDFKYHSQNKTFKLDADPEMLSNPEFTTMWAQLGLENKAAIIAPTEFMFFKIVQEENYTGDLRGQPGITILQVVSPNQYLPVEPDEVLTYRPYTWEKQIGKGKYIYTALGHSSADFAGGYLEDATWGMIKYLMGEYDWATHLDGKMAIKPDELRMTGRRLEVRYANAYRLIVVDIHGKEMLSEIGQGLHNYSLMDLRSGIYFAKVTGKSGSHSLRILVK